MKCWIGNLAAWCLATTVALGFAAPASAQVFTGRIDMTVEDATGGRLPGVTVDLTGPVNQNQVSDAQGEVHFLNLPVGIYSVKATLQGFNDFVNNTVQVATGSGGGMSAARAAELTEPSAKAAIKPSKLRRMADPSGVLDQITPEQERFGKLNHPDHFDLSVDVAEKPRTVSQLK